MIDTSALAAIIFGEPEREAFNDVLASNRCLISAGTLVEAGIVIEGRKKEAGGQALDVLLHRAKVEIVPIDQRQVEIARSGWRRYGKGRHPAGLNLGDLFGYALAKATGEPLLFKGNDFSLTDVVSATSAREH